MCKIVNSLSKMFSVLPVLGVVALLLAPATGARAATGSTGQGLSLMQESLSEATLAEVPLVVFNMARSQGDAGFMADVLIGSEQKAHPFLDERELAESLPKLLAETRLGGAGQRLAHGPSPGKVTR